MSTSKQITLNHGVSYQRQENEIHLGFRYANIVIHVETYGIRITYNEIPLAQVFIPTGNWRRIRLGQEAKFFAGPIVAVKSQAKHRIDGSHADLVQAHYNLEGHDTTLAVSTDLKLIAQNDELVIYRPADEILDQRQNAESDLSRAVRELPDQPNSASLTETREYAARVREGLKRIFGDPHLRPIQVEPQADEPEDLGDLDEPDDPDFR